MTELPGVVVPGAAAPGLDPADFAGHTALLLERLPGRPAGELAHVRRALGELA